MKITHGKCPCAELGLWGMMFAAVLLAEGGVAFGQEAAVAGSIRITAASAGYNQKTREDRWTPVRISVENNGPETDVLVVASSEEEEAKLQALVARRPLHLPAQAVRRETMYVNVSRGEHINVEIYEKGQRIARQTIIYNCEPPRNTLILGISVSGRGYSCRIEDSQTRGAAPRLIFNNSIQFFMDLPTRWEGYAAAEVIILGSLPPEGLSVAQETAIIDWVRSGGLLILCPLTVSDYRGTLFETVSPVQLIGNRVVEDVPPLVRLYDAERTIPREKARIGFTESVLRDGVVSMEMDGLPLLVSRAEGAGTVAYVAFDLAAERLTVLSGLQNFYRDLIERRGVLPRAADTLLAAEAAKNLNEAVGVPVLPRWAMGICLAANLACMGGLFYGLRRRRERGFLALVIAAPVLALVINLLGSKATGVAQTMLTSIHVVRSNSGEQAGSGSAYYAVLSPTEAVCNVQFPGTPSAFVKALSAWTPTARRSAAAAVGETAKVTEGDLVELQDLHVRPRALAMFQAEYLTALPGTVEATASATASGIQFRVQNKSGSLLSDAWVVCNRNAAPLGNLNPGETATALLDAGTARGLMAGFAGKTIRSERETSQEAIIRALYASRRYMDIFDTGPAVLGWMNQQPAQVQVTGLAAKPQASAETLWVVRADRAVAQGRLLLPKGTLGLQFRDFEHTLLQNGLWQRVTRPLTLNGIFSVPPDVRGLKASRIDFFLRFSQTPENVNVKVLNPETGEYDAVAGGTGRTRFSLLSADKYLSADGTVALRVRVEPVAGQGLTSAARAPVIEDFDMEIEGARE